jgi:hypothetical protein
MERPVVLNGIELGRPCDALIDVAGLRLAGLDIRCGDEGVRFLPFGAARIGPDLIHVDSPLLLLDEADRTFYGKRASKLGSLLGTVVECDGTYLGSLFDLVISADGAVESAALRVNGSGRRLRVDAAVAIGAAGRASTAR